MSSDLRARGWGAEVRSVISITILRILHVGAGGQERSFTDSLTLRFALLVCLLAGCSVAIAQDHLPMDMNAYCQMNYGSKSRATVLDRHDAASWRCKTPQGLAGIDLGELCRQQYGAGYQYSLGSKHDAASWSCRSENNAQSDDIGSYISAMENALIGGYYQFGSNTIGRIKFANIKRNGEFKIYSARGKRPIVFNIKNIKGSFENVVVCDDYSDLCVDAGVARWGGVRLAPNSSVSGSEFMGWFAYVWDNIRNK